MQQFYLILFAFFAGFVSCAQNAVKQKAKKETGSLTVKIIPLVSFLNNPDSCKKALAILDSATTIDNDCFLCHHNKIMFARSLKDFDKGITAINNCIRLNPNGNDLYMTGAMLYEMKGDSVSAAGYFQKALKICNAVLDTMNIKNVNYSPLATSQALSLLLLGETKKANVQLQKLYAAENDTMLKKNIAVFMNKTRKEVIDMIGLTPDQPQQETFPVQTEQ